MGTYNDDTHVFGLPLDVAAGCDQIAESYLCWIGISSVRQSDILFPMLRLRALHRNIHLDAVAALHGIAAVDGAQKSLLVTTSAYEPVAKRFAARTSGAMELATSQDVAQWCDAAAVGIITDKSTLVSKAHVSRVVAEVSRALDHRVVRATSGYDMTLNSFALVIKETKHAALLMALPKATVSHDGYGQTGYEVPVLDHTAMAMQKADAVWRAKRRVANVAVTYWDGSKLYSSWDGRPAFFSYVN